MGSDIDIILHCNSRLSDAEVNNIKDLLKNGLIACDYPFEEGDISK